MVPLPGNETTSYSEDERNAGAPATACGRLAVFSSINSDVDPTLHHLGLPYDEDARSKWNPEALSTQLIEAEVDREAFGQQHTNTVLTQTTAGDVVSMLHMDRISGVVSAEQILARGWMRVSRRGSLVGDVGPSGGRLRLNRDYGNASSNFGVGFSAGPKS